MTINILDILGAGLALTSTYYFTKAARFAWAIGLIAIVINVILYWQKAIYGHLLLECIYFCAFIIGLWKWRPHNRVLTVQRLSLKQILYLMSISVLFILLVAWCLLHLTDSPVAIPDAITTVLSITAQILLIYKYLQCWIVWLIVDVIVAGMQFQQGMPFHGLSTTLYCALAVLGYRRWSGLLKSEQPTPLSDKIARGSAY